MLRLFTHTSRDVHTARRTLALTRVRTQEVTDALQGLHDAITAMPIGAFGPSMRSSALALAMARAEDVLDYHDE